MQWFFARLVFWPTVAWSVLLERCGIIRRWDRIDEQVVLGGLPFRRDVPKLLQEGVAAVINTCEEYAGPVREYEQYGIEQLRIPTTDFTHPKLVDVEQAVEFVQSHVDKDEIVYIHCKAGRARSATVALCWLMKYRGMTADQAQAKLLESRPHTNPNVAKRPVVQQFAQKLASGPHWEDDAPGEPKP